MPSYYVPTVVQTTIPDGDMTPLERLVLSHIFTAEPDGDGVYLFAEESPAECVEVGADELRVAHRESAGADSVLDAIVGGRLTESGGGDTHVELDLSIISWSTILQDVVRRSATLDEIAVSSAFTCSRMRADGWGGMATLITPPTTSGRARRTGCSSYSARRQSMAARREPMSCFVSTRPRCGRRSARSSPMMTP